MEGTLAWAAAIRLLGGWERAGGVRAVSIQTWGERA